VQDEPPSGPKDEAAGRDLLRLMHKTIKRVTDDLEGMRFNTMIAALMEYSNGLARARERGVEPAVWEEAVDTLLLLVAPSGPHMAEELWAALGHSATEREDELSLRPWPVADLQLTAEETVHIAVQVNGKLRGEVLVPAAAAEEEIRTAAALDPKIRNWIDGKTVKKVVVIPKRLVNFVVA
jgi:leucyl-tRNA synthetase